LPLDTVNDETSSAFIRIRDAIDAGKLVLTLTDANNLVGNLASENVEHFIDGNNTINDAPSPMNYSNDLSEVTEDEIRFAEAQGLKIIGKITDETEIRSMADSGQVSRSNGELPGLVIIYAALDDEDDSNGN